VIPSLLDPFLASRLDLDSRNNDGYGGKGYTYGRLYNITTCHDLMASSGSIHYSPTLMRLLRPMLTTILPSFTDITSKGTSESEPSLETASKIRELAPNFQLGSEMKHT